MIENKFIFRSIYFIMKILNILTMVPLVLAFVLVMLTLCIVDLALFLSPISLILNILIPSLAINFGINSFMLKLIAVVIAVFMGCYLYKTLKVYLSKYLSFASNYIKKSFVFKLDI